MQIFKIILATLGILQNIIGVSFGTLAVLVGFDIVGIDEVVNLPTDLLPLYLLVLGLFCIFSIVNGLFLIREWRKKERRGQLIGQ